MAESQGTYAMGCPSSGGAVADLGGGGGGVQGVCTPHRIFDDSYYVTPCPKLCDLGASHARLCMHTVGQTIRMYTPPLEIPASAPGTTLGWHRN